MKEQEVQKLEITFPKVLPGMSQIMWMKFPRNTYSISNQENKPNRSIVRSVLHSNSLLRARNHLFEGDKKTHIGRRCNFHTPKIQVSYLLPLLYIQISPRP